MCGAKGATAGSEVEIGYGGAEAEPPNVLRWPNGKPEAYRHVPWPSRDFKSLTMFPGILKESRPILKPGAATYDFAIASSELGAASSEFETATSDFALACCEL